MSANKKEDNGKHITLRGKVVQKPFGAGSKSAYDAVCLETDQGSYVLRRVGGNPFQDTSLQKLVGKEITAEGVISGYIFFVTDVQEMPSDEC